MNDDPDTRVIVFESADPEFFIAHVDMTLGKQPEALQELQRDVPENLNPFQAFAEALGAQPQVTIVKLAGLARGGGAEFVLAADMAFGAEERAGLAQCEALMGIIPGGGATQYLGQRMTRGRVLEAILGADLFDAKTPNGTAGSIARFRPTNRTASSWQGRDADCGPRWHHAGSGSDGALRYAGCGRDRPCHRNLRRSVKPIAAFPDIRSQSEPPWRSRWPFDSENGDAFSHAVRCRHAEDQTTYKRHDQAE
jgi:hypothetical protein